MSSLNCVEVDEFLGAYVLTALSDQERSAVDRHLRDCDRHQSTLERLVRASQLLTLAAPYREPRPELGARIRRATRSAPAPGGLALGRTGERLTLGSHVCFFHSGDGELKQALTFVRDGFQQPGEFAAVFGDRRHFETLTAWLQEGCPATIQSVVDRGQLALIGGAPQVDQLLEGIARRLDQAMTEGYRLIRFLGLIGWGEPGWPDTDALIDFEHRVNAVVKTYPAVIVCTYDVLRLSGRSLIEGGLQMHPITILGDRVIRENPFHRAA